VIAALQTLGALLEGIDCSVRCGAIVDPAHGTSESRYRIRYPDRTMPPVIPQWRLARQHACTPGEYGCYNMPHTLSLFQQ
jgi:hypothetical protein